MPRFPSLRTLPLSITLPAAAAALAYIDAKHLVSSDLWAISGAIRFAKWHAKLEQDDRVNTFYRFEELARNPKTAHRVFLIVPSDDDDPDARTQWTYREAYEIILKYARWLHEERRVKKHEIIAMDFKNKPIFIWLWFALWSLGAKPAFLNSNLRDTAFIHCAKISSSRLLLLDAELQDALTEEALQQFSPDDKGRVIETVVLEPALEAYIEQLDPYRAPNEARSGTKAADASMLIYTSGTTGLPKAANVSWAKPLSGEWFFPKVLKLTSDDRYFTAMPLYHSSASVLGVCQAVGANCAMIVSPKFSARTQMKQITETKATVMQYIGEMCRYLVTTPPSPYDRAHKLRLAFGNGMRPDVWLKFQERFGVGAVCEFYGATEAPGASFVYSNNDFLRGAIGKGGLIFRTLFGGNSAFVRHDTETELPQRDPKTGFCIKTDPNEPGELLYLLDPENISEKFQGYFGNDKASSSKIIRDVFKKGDAWYRSGDLQRRDEDGRVYFVDRIGDTFRWKGENVSTAEVGEAMSSHPALEEANVYGIQLPNHDGRAGCAAIKLTEGNSLDGPLAGELAEHIRKRLPRYAVPLFLRLTREIVVTGTHKHQKVALRNEGVDPSKTGDDQIYWLPPGSSQYVRYGEKDWQKLVGGSAKL